MDLPQPKKEYKRLTIEKLRSFKGLEKLSDEEALEAIEALEKLSVIMFELYQQHKAKQNENNLTSSTICERKAA
jgi:hypothetical protein